METVMTTQLPFAAYNFDVSSNEGGAVRVQYKWFEIAALRALYDLRDQLPEIGRPWECGACDIVEVQHLPRWLDEKSGTTFDCHRVTLLRVKDSNTLYVYIVMEVLFQPEPKPGRMLSQQDYVLRAVSQPTALAVPEKEWFCNPDNWERLHLS